MSITAVRLFEGVSGKENVENKSQYRDCDQAYSDESERRARYFFAVLLSPKIAVE